MDDHNKSSWATVLRGQPIAGYLGGRDNNLNLIRIVAASAVLVSHAFALTSGDVMNEPFRTSTGLSLGQFAVAIFFGMSGLLIARSFDRKQSLAHFLRWCLHSGLSKP